MKFKNLLKHNINIDALINELDIKATHSSGKGGQNVNKVSTKIVLIFDLTKSVIISRGIKEELRESLKKKLTKNGQIHIQSSAERSQFLNKQHAIYKFLNLLDVMLEPRIERIATKPTKGSVEKRIIEKNIKSEKKQLRKISKQDIE